MRTRSPYLPKPDFDHKAPALRSLFPGLMELRLELEFVQDLKWPSSNQVHVLHPPASASFRYPCPTGGCNGQFKLDMPVMRLLQSSQSTVVAEVGCGGVRPQDRITGKACTSTLKYKVEASYRT